MMNAKTCGVAFAAILTCPPALLAVTSEPNFEVTTLADGFYEPIVLLPIPGGRLLVGEKGGNIRVVDLATRQVSIWAFLNVFTNAECGLLGLALHPDFAHQPYVYVFATISKTEQQIIQLRDQGGVGVEPIEIRGSIPTEGGHHNGGGLRVGPDNMLYFSVGDNGIPPNSQSMNTLSGKVCRIGLDGTVPRDNPFTTPTGAPRAIHALGFRNPFRFCFSSDGTMFVMDVGSNADERREEIDLVTAGTNYGWPLFEGIDPDAPGQGFINPIYSYVDEGSAPAGCLVYEGIQFPREFRGNLFHLDYTSNALFRTVLDGGHVESHTIFVQDEGATVDLAMLPDGSLVYTQMLTGRVRQVSYRGPPPTGQPSDSKSDVHVAADELDSAAKEESSPAPKDSAPSCGQGLLALLPLAGLLSNVRSRKKRGPG